MILTNQTTLIIELNLGYVEVPQPTVRYLRGAYRAVKHRKGNTVSKCSIVIDIYSYN